jgi:signal transduction histidine kinase
MDVKASETEDRAISGLAQSLWDQMRAEQRADALPRLSDACRLLRSGYLGPLTETQTEDLDSMDRSLTKLTRRFEGEPIDWTDYSVAAHALRGPLNSTIGFSRLMLKGADGPITAAQRDALETIYVESRKLLVIFNLLLDALLLVGQGIGFSSEPVQADEILQELIAVGQTLAENREFIFEANVMAEITQTTIHSDAKRLKQALSALLAASVKHMRAGRLTLRAWLGENRLLIQFENQACQLPAPLLASLPALLTAEADRSFPYDAHLRLGLAWRFLAEMGGGLEAQRNNEKCAFTVTLPLVRNAHPNHA